LSILSLFSCIFRRWIRIYF